MSRCKWCPDGHAKVGDFVQSRYQAKWSGTVLAERWIDAAPWEDVGQIQLLRVRQEIDRNGNPIRNRKSVEYGACYFRKVATPVVSPPNIAVGGTVVSIDTSIAVAVDPLL